MIAFFIAVFTISVLNQIIQIPIVSDWLDERLGDKNTLIKKIFTVINILVIIIFGAIAIKDQINKIKYGNVFISPSEISIKPLDQVFHLKVTNNNDYPIYEYQILIKVLEGNLSINKYLRIKPLKETKELPYSLIGLGGYLPNGKEYMELKLFELNAHTTAEFLVSVDASKNDKLSTISFEIARYTLIPNPLYKTPSTNGVCPPKFPDKLIK